MPYYAIRKPFQVNILKSTIKTRELLEKASGGVLFIDEAYSLGNSEKRDSFSKEAIDMINQYLSENKNDLMVIIAGYDEELDKCFFAYNPGLKRRFSSYYKIEGYDYNELIDIFLEGGLLITYGG